MKPVTLTLNATDMAALKQGMWALTSEPAFNLAIRVIDRLEDQALASMTVEQAKEWVRVVTAPMALGVEKKRRIDAESRVEFLEGRTAELGAMLDDAVGRANANWTRVQTLEDRLRRLAGMGIIA